MIFASVNIALIKAKGKESGRKTLQAATEMNLAIKVVIAVEDIYA